MHVLYTPTRHNIHIRILTIIGIVAIFFRTYRKDRIRWRHAVQSTHTVVALIAMSLLVNPIFTITTTIALPVITGARFGAGKSCKRFHVCLCFLFICAFQTQYTAMCCNAHTINTTITSITNGIAPYTTKLLHSPLPSPPRI